VRDLTGPDLRNAVLALAAGNAAVSNDSGLLHVAAALGTPAIGIFRADEPVALGSAQSDCCRDRDCERACVPPMPQTGLPLRPSSLHARHSSRSGRQSGRSSSPDSSHARADLSRTRSYFNLDCQCRVIIPIIINLHQQY
jgi:hypothetical protein